VSWPSACADGPAIGIGGPLPGGAKPFNAYYILQGGEISATVLKHHLPNYNVFDEKRYYHAGDPAGPVRVGPVRIGSPICEDAWFEDVTETLAETGAEILLVPNGSPYHRGKIDIRQAQMVARVVETGLPLVYLNMVGGQDDQVFDGASPSC
jgi:NAD+ synthase